MIKKHLRNFSKFRFSIFLLLTFFLLIKILFLFKSNFWISLFSDLIAVPVVILTVYKFIELQDRKRFTQIQLLTGFIFFEIIFILFSETSLYILGPTLKSLKEFVVKPTFFIGIISGFFSVVYIFFISIILSILTILFFSRQKKTIKNYYAITVIYFVLASLGANLEKHFEILWVKYTFGSLTIFFFIILTYLNKWVVYLTRKEKIKVIGLCNVLLGIIIFALIKSGSKDQLEELISLFSSSVVTAYNLIFGMAFVYSIVLLILTIFQLPATEVIEKKTFEIESLQNLSQMISRVLDIDELISYIIQTISKISSSNYVWLCLFDESDHCRYYSKNNDQIIDVDKMKNEIIDRINPTNEIKIINIDLTNSLIYPNQEIQKVIYIPLIYNDKLLGYIFIGFDRTQQYEIEDINTLKSIGEYAVIAIQNSRLLQKSIEKERLEKELEVAREIQKKLLPEKSPKIPELDIASLFIPAFEVGGDYYDFFQTDDDKFSFVIADVSGKGISAAFYMAEVKGIFESLSKIISSPKEILIQANKILCKTLNKKSFVSAIFATVDIITGDVRIVRGGHCPIILIKNKDIIHLKPSGIALGFNCTNLFEHNLDEISFMLEPDDLLILYTDGVTEARNKHLEEFGRERLNLILKQNYKNTSEQILQSLIKNISLFSQGFPQHDDITLIAIKYLGVKK